MSANLIGAEAVEDVTEPEGQPEDEGIFYESEEAVAEQPQAEEETAESDAEESAEGESVESFETLEQLAEAAGMSLDDLLDKVTAPIKQDGQESREPLRKALAERMMEADYRRKTSEVAEQRKALEQRLAEADQQAQVRLQQLDDTIQLAARELNAEYAAINWQQLREEDPSEFSARQLEFQQRQGRLNQAYAQLQQERQQAQHQSQQQYEAFLQEEHKKLLQAIPEWTDPKVAEKERTDLVGYAVETYGYDTHQVASINDHRQVQILRKAMLWDQLQKSKPEVENKVKRAPKITRPGSQKAPKPKPQSIEDVFYSNS